MNKRKFFVPKSSSVSYERWKYWIDSRYPILFFALLFLALLIYSELFFLDLFIQSILLSCLLWVAYYFTARENAKIAVSLYLIYLLIAPMVYFYNLKFGFDIFISNFFPATMLGLVLCFFAYVKFVGAGVK